MTGGRRARVSLSLQRASALKTRSFFRPGSRPHRHRRDGHCLPRGVSAAEVSVGCPSHLPGGCSQMPRAERGQGSVHFCYSPGNEQPGATLPASKQASELGERIKAQTNSQAASGSRPGRTKNPLDSQAMQFVFLTSWARLQKEPRQG